MAELRVDQKSLLLAAVASVAAWCLPFVSLITLPLILLNTHLHELSHALAALATGGQVEHILVFSNGSGVTPVLGGNVFAVTAAGYVGSTLFGGLMVYLSRTVEGAKTVLGIMAALLGFSMLVWVRGDSVGVLSGWLWTISLIVGAIKLRGRVLVFASQFLGVSQCLTSAQAFLALLSLSASSQVDSDAQILAHSTNIPALVWALLWCGFSGLTLAATLRHAWSGKSRPLFGTP